MTSILGHPDQVTAALVTQLVNGATVTVTGVHNIPDGRVLVDVDIIEPLEILSSTHPSASSPSFTRSDPAPQTSPRQECKTWLQRLWATVAPEPIEKILHPGEICQLWKHRHWFLHARSVIKGLAGLPLVIGLAFLVRAVAEHLWWLQLILWFTPLLNAAQIGYKVLEWMSDRIIVTDRRLILASGVLQRRIQAMPLNRIRGIDMTRTLVGRIFGFGTLKIGYPSYDPERDTTGLPMSEIEFVPWPKKVYHAIGLAKSSSSSA